MDRLNGKTCLITGSTGIAGAAAELFAAEGARVFVTSKTEAHCAELVDRLQATGAEAAYAVADLRDQAEANAAVAACQATFGRIDALLAVAGGSGRPFGDGPIQYLDRRCLGLRPSPSTRVAMRSSWPRSCGPCSRRRLMPKARVVRSS